MTANPAAPMTHDDLMRRAGARWCVDHDRWECAANKADHHASAMRGMAMCRHHVGKATDLARTQGEVNLAVWSAEAGRDLPPIDQAQAVMAQLRVAVYRADLYGELLRLQVADEEVGGLVGKTYAAGRDGQRVETGEAARGLAKLEAEWRDRVVKYAEAAHRMGIASQALELAQAQAELVVLAFRAALEAAGAELLPAVRAVMVSTFLARLDRADAGVLEGGGS